MSIQLQLFLFILLAATFTSPIVRYYRKRYKLLEQYKIVIQKTKALNEYTFKQNEERLERISDYITQANYIMNILRPKPDISFKGIEFKSYTMDEIFSELKDEKSLLCSLVKCSNATVTLIMEHSKSLSELYAIKCPYKYRRILRQNEIVQKKLDKLINEFNTNKKKIKRVVKEVVKNAEVETKTFGLKKCTAVA